MADFHVQARGRGAPRLPLAVLLAAGLVLAAPGTQGQAGRGGASGAGVADVHDTSVTQTPTVRCNGDVVESMHPSRHPQPRPPRPPTRPPEF